mgnify:FL=1
MYQVKNYNVQGLMFNKFVLKVLVVAELILWGEKGRHKHVVLLDQSSTTKTFICTYDFMTFPVNQSYVVYSTV